MSAATATRLPSAGPENARPVPGWPGDFARVLTALEMANLHEGGGTDGMRGAIRFAALCTVDAEGVQVFADEAAAGAADWRRIKAAALAGFTVNGLIEEDDAEEPAAGN